MYCPGEQREHRRRLHEDGIRSALGALSARLCRHDLIQTVLDHVILGVERAQFLLELPVEPQMQLTESLHIETVPVVGDWVELWTRIRKQSRERFRQKPFYFVHSRMEVHSLQRSDRPVHSCSGDAICCDMTDIQ